MVHKMPKGTKKRQFSQSIVKSGELVKVRPPADQSFDCGISIEFNSCGYNTQTGKRDKFVQRIEGRFPHSESGCDHLATFFEQNCDGKHIADLYKDVENARRKQKTNN